MNAAAGRAPSAYEIRVHGHLDDHWVTWHGGQAITRSVDGTSAATAPVADQARLHGVLTGLRDIGATILEVRPASPAAAMDPDFPLNRSLRTERLTSARRPSLTPMPPGRSGGSTRSVGGSPAVWSTLTSTGKPSPTLPVLRRPSSSSSVAPPTRRWWGTSCSAARTRGASGRSRKRRGERKPSCGG